MKQRLRVLLVLSLLWVAVPPMWAARATASANLKAPAAATEPPGTARPVFPVMRADHTSLHQSARTRSGEIWAIGHRGGNVVLRWNGGTWVTEEEVTSWPAWVGAQGLVADPLNADSVLSVWRTAGSKERGRPHLQVRRHRAGTPSVLISDIVDPRGKEDGSGVGPRVIVTVDEGGRIWLTSRDPWLIGVPTGDGEPTVSAIPSDLFQAPPHRWGGLHGLAYTASSVSDGWLWLLPMDYAETRKAARMPGELLRPVRIVDGAPSADVALPAGLPTQPRVTLIRPAADGGTIWGVEGEGLWRVDPDGKTATRRTSPPEVWRVVDWRAFPDGTEVALVTEAKTRRDLMGGRIFVCRNGRWLDAGLAGAPTVSLDLHNPAGPSHFDWHLADGVLLGAGFSLGLVAVDLDEIAAGVASRPRKLDWRTALPVTDCQRLHPLAGGELLIQGNSAVLATPAELRAGWRAAESAGEPAAYDFHEHAHRAPDGRLWMVRSGGVGSPKVMHWDGVRWHDFPLPDMYSQNGYEPIIWVDEAGRIALFSMKLEGVAWERGSSASGAWQKFENGWKLIEARAADPKKAKSVRALGHPRSNQAEIAADGRALVGVGSELKQWSRGSWSSLTKEAGQGILWHLGFDEAGRPWTEGNGVRRVFEADGRETATKLSKSSPYYITKEGTWPAWLAAVLDEKTALASREDSEGVWWVSTGGELWKGWNGEVVKVFSEDERSPFRKNRGVGFNDIRVDPSGGRFFMSWPYILLPAGRGPSVSFEWIRDAGAVADRAGRVTGAGVHFYRWRIDGGEWRRSGPAEPLLLRELPRGEHLLEVAAFSPRLDAGPVLRERFKVDYKVSRRVAELIDTLRTVGPAGRADVVRRLGAHGAEAAAALRKRIAAERDDDRRWWLRAALQAVEDRREDEKSKRP